MAERNKRFCVIFDMDGVLADNAESRKYVEREAPDYAGFNAACAYAAPRKAWVELARTFNQAGYEVHVLTARSEEVREQTEAWLDLNQLCFVVLHMRPLGNSLPDARVKEAMLGCPSLKECSICGVFEDDAACAAMYREKGLCVLHVGKNKAYPCPLPKGQR